jgi:hypothetical protein
VHDASLLLTRKLVKGVLRGDEEGAKGALQPLFPYDAAPGDTVVTGPGAQRLAGATGEIEDPIA